MTPQRYKLTIAYDGTEFFGWQRQTTPQGNVLRTVQGEMTNVMQRLFAQPIKLVGASRTDRGVHANAQIAHFDAISRIPVDRMANAITGKLSHDVEVRLAEEVPTSFDAITQAKNKQYRYRIFCSEHRPLGLRHMMYHCFTQLDLDRMNNAAQRLMGTHDVEGFSAAGHGRANTIRTIYDCHVEKHDEQVHIVVQGSGFLYNMVRIIAGTLMDVGRGRFEPAIINTILQTADRQYAGPTLPPQGLCLEWISYDEVKQP